MKQAPLFPQKPFVSVRDHVRYMLAGFDLRQRAREQRRRPGRRRSPAPDCEQFALPLAVDDVEQTGGQLG